MDDEDCDGIFVMLEQALSDRRHRRTRTRTDAALAQTLLHCCQAREHLTKLRGAMEGGIGGWADAYLHRCASTRSSETAER